MRNFPHTILQQGSTIKARHSSPRIRAAIAAILSGLTLFTVPTTTPLLAQEGDAQSGAALHGSDPYPYFRMPQSLPKSAYRHLFQVGLAKLPEDVVEAASSLIRAPLFEYKGLYGLPSNFAVAGGVSSNIVTFHFSLGPRWNYFHNEWSFSAGYDVAFWFGQLEAVDGFDTSIDGWLNYPNVSIGYRVEDIAFTVTVELILATSLTTSVGDTEVGTESNFVGGYTVALYVEQPLWKDNYLLLGVKSNYARLYYPLWAAFSTFDRYFYIPEFTVGFVL